MSNVNACSYGWRDSDSGQVLNVSTFGAAGDGVNDDTTAITSALTAASATFNGGIGGVVFLPKGTYLVSSQIVVPNKVVLSGAGRNATEIKASSSFPANTAVVRLGDGTSLVFGCRVENLEINCGAITGSTGIYSTDINEQSGAWHVSVINYNSKGIWIDGSGTNQPDNYLFDDVNCGFSATASTPYGFYLDTPGEGGQLRRCTVNRNSGAVTGTAGVYVTTAVAGGNSITIIGLNTESYTDGVLFDTNTGGAVINATLHVGGTSLIHINSVFPVFLSNLLRSVGTNIVQNDTISQNLTTLRLAHYVAIASTEGYQVISSVGSSSSSGNVVSNVQPLWMVKSTATSGANSRAGIELRDGNNDGWRIRFGADGTNDPFQMMFITTGTLGSTVWQVDDTGVVNFVDGVAAPDTSAGFTRFYVDTADGDYKIKFGDGATKTLAVDATGAGTFTVTAAALTSVTDGRSTSSSQVSFSPLNATAGLLVRTKTCYVSSVAPGSFSFTVSATGAGAPDGTEQFQYTISPP